MKSLKTLFTALLLLCCTVATAHDFEVDGIYYNILSEEDKTVEVTSGATSYTGSIVIPATVTKPGTSEALYSVTTIRCYAFSYCSSLTSIKIPNSVTTIEYGAFSSCTSLTSIKIPNSVTTIENSAFYFCTSLTNIEIPNSVTTIGDYAFYFCTSLTSIEIPNSVTTIGEEAFHGCYSLTSIAVDENNPIYDSRSNCNAIIETVSNTLISSCINTIIPNNVTTIGQFSFSYSSLKSINIPNSVTTIGKYAFSDCWNLKSITIPNSVTTIGEGAFSSCENITNITVDENNPVYDSRNNCNAIIETFSNTLISGCKNTAIPNSIVTIGNSAFYGLSSLKSINIPNSVITIGESAFSCCNLTSISIPNSVTTIGYSAFFSCSLTSIEIPNSVTTIGSSAFYGCSSLASIEIPNSVTNIGEHAFNDTPWYNNQPDGIIYAGKVLYKYKGRMPASTSITIKEGTVGIAVSAFYGCSSLASIEIPNSVTKIGNYAFYDCTSLTSIEIPNSVTTIGKRAFYNCSSLTSITSHIPAEKLFAPGSDAFTEIDKENCTLYVPKGAKETYAVTEGWSEFVNIVELPTTFDLTVSAAGYATLYLDYNAVIPQGVEVYTANTVKGDRLMLQQVNGVLPANTAAIVRAEQGTYEFTKSDDEVAAIENNLLRGSVEDEYITPKKGFAYYVLSMKNGIVGMYKDELTGGTFKNNANKAYLVLTDITVNDEEVDTQTPGVQLSNSYYFDFGGTTAVDEVATGVNDNIYYDLSGRRVENPTSGIYILNGNKVLVK